MYQRFFDIKNVTNEYMTVKLISIFISQASVADSFNISKDKY